MTILTGTLADFTAIGPQPAADGYLRLRLDSFDAEHTTREWTTPVFAGGFATELPDLTPNGSVYLRAEGVPGFPSVHIGNYDGLTSVTLLDLLTATNSDGTARFIIDPLTRSPQAPVPATAAQLVADATAAATNALDASASAQAALGVANMAVVSGAVVGDDLTLTRKNGETFNAGNVRGTAGAGVPYGVALTTQDLNDVTTAGAYRQPAGPSATLARNYPYAGNSGVLEVFDFNGSAGYMQRFTTNGGASGDMRGFYQRRKTNSTTWGAWQYIARQRVDTTAGRAIYTWDDISGRDQLVYGDTGLRNVTADIAGAAATGLQLRRVGQLVELSIDTLTVSASGTVTFYTLPTGFRPAGTRRNVISATGGPSAGRNLLTNTSGTVVLGAAVTGETYNTSLTFFTSDPWPTTLPGAALGTIPNL